MKQHGTIFQPGNVLAHLAAIAIGFVMLIAGLGLGVTMIGLPLGIPIGSVGLVLLVWGGLAWSQQGRS